MKIKELLRARKRSSARARDADTMQERESEFSVISSIAEKLRRLRKRDQAADAGKPVETGETKGTTLS